MNKGRFAALAVVFSSFGPQASHAQTPKANADVLLQRAMQEQERGDFAAAIRDYRKALTLQPGETEARVNLGAALAHEGQFDAAIAEYRTALPSLTFKEPVLLNMGLAYYKKHDFRSAQQQFQAVHAAQPENLRVAILLGDTDLHLGQAADAVALLAPFEAGNSSNMDYEYVLGTALTETGAREEGVAKLEKVGAATKSADAYLLAGSTLLKMNEYERSRRDLDAAVDLNPKLPGLLSLAGTARDKNGDVPAAEQAFRGALQLNPDDFNANLYLGAILYKRRELEDARRYLDHALQIDPKSSMAIYESAMLKSNSGQIEAAVADLEKLAISDPEWLEPHVALASLYYRVNRPEDGAKQREIVGRLTAAQQAEGPGKP